MAEEVGIVMSLYDRVSPTLKSIAGSSKAFDKTLDDLEASLKSYGQAQDALVSKSASLKKAMAESNLKVQEAQKSYKKLKDETSKGALDAAIDEQTRLRQELQETEGAIQANSSAYKALYKAAQNAAAGISKADNRAAAAGTAGDTGGLLAGLRSAGLTKMLGDSLAQAANIGIESMLGQPTATAVSSLVSGIASGAAVGSIAGPAGMAIGALVGGISGAISGGAQIFQAQDDAFKSYVQEGAEGQLSARDTAVASGSSIAGSREQKQLAFSTLLGSDQAAEAFLGRVKSMAAKTNYTYDEITGYAKSLVGPFGAEASLGILNTLSDASAALSLNESDNQMLIKGLSRMKLQDKTTREYLDYFSERGVDVYEALSRWGDAATVAEKVTAGQIKGSDAAQAILDYMDEQYGGLSEKMANTYEGMMGNLEDARANAEEAYGIGYNAERREGVQAETEWLESGAMDEANKAIGAWQARLENEKERYVREAVKGMMETDEYQQAQAEGDAAEMGRLIMQAKVKGMSEYNASDGAQEALAAEKALVAGIRDDASLNADYWDAGYEKGQEYTKGLAASIQWFQNQEMGRALDPTSAAYAQSLEDNAKILSSHAYGLNRVPYDNFPALLHEGERVLTAREARQADQGGGTAVSISGNMFIVRQESDVSAIAEELLRRIETAQRAGVR